MQERRFSAAELATIAGLPLPTLTFFLREGVLTPSVQRASGRGRGHVFSFDDVLAARTLNALRFQNAAAGPLKRLVQFWHTTDGQRLVESLRFRKDGRKASVLLVTDGGIEVDASPADVMEKYGTAVVYCIDAAKFVDDVTIAATEGLMRLAFQQPGPSGRMPSKVSAATTRRRAPREAPYRAVPHKKKTEQKSQASRTTSTKRKDS